MRLRALVLLLLSTCGSPRRAGVVEVPPEAPAGPALLPTGPGPLAPSFARVDGDRDIDGNDLTNVEQCGSCHLDVQAQWQTSAHAFASFNNPIYRVSVDRLREARGAKASRFCGGCHDPSLIFDGLMDAAEIDPLDRRAHAGVTCRTCHSIVHTTPDGNGSYALNPAEIPIPAQGDLAGIAAHKARVAGEALRTAEMCISCHRVFLDPGSGNQHHLFGQDDGTPWQRSAFAGNQVNLLDDEELVEQDCRGCHMAMEEAPLGDLAATDGKVASHRFLGGHTWLAAMRKDADSLRRTQEFLKKAASIDVAAVVHGDGRRSLPADGAEVRAGERVVFDVVVRNLQVGHRFPGGTLDAHDTWIEVVVTDAAGRLVAEAGTEQAATGKDPEAHGLRAALIGNDGVPRLERETHDFRAVVWNHTIAPRDAIAVQYGLTIPRAEMPLRVTATLRHRSRNLALAAAACAEGSSPRGKKFREAAQEFMKDADACVAQPITDLATKAVEIGEGARPAEKDWRRLYEHGLAMSHALQERLDEARPSLDAALALAPTPRARAQVLTVLAGVAARQGRVDEARALVARAEELLPGHPVLARLRGDALAQVWRWREAMGPAREAADGAPHDYSMWMQAAIAAGSADDPRAALEAARRGLALQPRDPDLLRVQALALKELGAPDEEVEAAMAAYLERRVADDTPGLRAKCSKNVAGCARERNPVHVHELRLARPKRP